MSDGKRWVQKIDEFLKLIVDSRLVTAKEMEDLFINFKDNVLQSSPFGNTITGLSSYLVSKGVLTCWQVDKLREGKYKGFFYYEHRLLDLLSSSASGAIYLAEREGTSQLVALEVRPAQRRGDEIPPPRVVQVFEC